MFGTLLTLKVVEVGPCGLLTLVSNKSILAQREFFQFWKIPRESCSNEQYVWCRGEGVCPVTGKLCLRTRVPKPGLASGSNFFKIGNYRGFSTETLIGSSASACRYLRVTQVQVPVLRKEHLHVHVAN